MSSFTYPLLAWGFLLVMAPLLIHLINLMRLRRVKWAAMDFLLRSYKKHRRWVWLKQLLLLLARMAAIALVVAMLAKWDPREDWLSGLRRTTTHHYILLDDSFSMSERIGAASAFDAANRVVLDIATQAAAEDTQQRFTLLRFSKAARAPKQASDEVVAQMTDLNAEIVDQNFAALLEEKRRVFDVTQLNVGPRPALEVAKQMLSGESDENRLLYVVSDFRSNQWSNPSELRDLLQDLEKSDADLQLISCVRQPQTNLAITDVQPSSETRAAGVPLFVNVTLRNFGPTQAKNVQLRVRTTFFPARADMQPEDAAGEQEELPVELIESIASGEQVVRRVQVYFPQPGRHVVEAYLPEDAVPADNHRYCVVDFPEGEPVLIVDGAAAQENAFYLQAIFNPGARAKTGVIPDVQNAAFLRDASPESLQTYRTIYLCDVARLDERAVENLEDYVRNGGGVAFFVGPNVSFRFYNEQLHRDGEGLFPIPLGRDEILPPPVVEGLPDVDIEGTAHPVFRDLLLGANPMIRLVSVERYLAPPRDWAPKPDSTAEVVAKLYNGAPLVVEKPFGEGRVMATLTTYAPDWNDLALGPNVLIALKMQSYLGARGGNHPAARNLPDYQVGAPLSIQLDSQRFRRDVRFVLPGGSEGVSRLVIDGAGVKASNESTVMDVALSGDSGGLDRGETDVSGVYEVWLTSVEGDLDIRRFAYNVDALEGDLSLESSAELLNQLQPVKPTFRHADDFQSAAALGGGFNADWPFLLVLVVLLIVEMLLAFSSSYHTAQGVAR